MTAPAEAQDRGRWRIGDALEHLLPAAAGGLIGSGIPAVMVFLGWRRERTRRLQDRQWQDAEVLAETLTRYTAGQTLIRRPAPKMRWGRSSTSDVIRYASGFWSWPPVIHPPPSSPPRRSWRPTCPRRSFSANGTFTTCSSGGIIPSSPNSLESAMRPQSRLPLTCSVRSSPQRRESNEGPRSCLRPYSATRSRHLGCPPFLAVKRRMIMYGSSLTDGHDSGGRASTGGHDGAPPL